MPDDPEPSGWFREHLTLVATVLFFVAVGLKLLFITRFDIEAALAVLRASGPATVAVGSFIAGFKSFSYMVALAAGLWLEWHWKDHTNPLLFGFVVAAGFFGLLATVFLYDLVFVGFVIGAPFLGRWVKRSGQSKDQGKDLSWRALSAIIWLLITTSFMSGDMWLPLERVETNDGQTQTAYVLEDQGRWTTLLEERHRLVLEVEQQQIESRSICYVDLDESFWSVSLWELLARRTPSAVRPVCETE